MEVFGKVLLKWITNSTKLDKKKQFTKFNIYEWSQSLIAKLSQLYLFKFLTITKVYLAIDKLYIYSTVQFIHISNDWNVESGK